MITLVLFCAALPLFSFVHGYTYEALPNGPGCSKDLVATTSECKTAAASLKYEGSFHVGSYGHAPPGCHVGHPSDGWAHVYFNKNGTGTLGRSIYKSICHQNGTSKIPEAYALTIPNEECLEEDSILYWGNDINGTLVGGIADCANWCGEVEACKFWTYVKSAKYCWLKTKDTDRRINADRISGTKACVAAIDGEWSAWSDFGTCSATCGNAITTRERTCSNPPPKNGGKTCPGMNSETVPCSLGSCVTTTVAPVTAAANQGCKGDAYGISCCPTMTTGDNVRGTDIFIQQRDMLEGGCQATCKEKHPTSTGITQSTNEKYSSGKPKCWCEFGTASLTSNKNYETCMFN